MHFNAWVSLKRTQSNHILLLYFYNCDFFFSLCSLLEGQCFSTKYCFHRCHFWAIWFWTEIKINTVAFQENPRTLSFHQNLAHVTKFWDTLSKNNTQGNVIKGQTLQFMWVVLQGLRWWLHAVAFARGTQICWGVWKLIFSVINMASLPSLVPFYSSLSIPSQHLHHHSHHSHNGNTKKCLLIVRRNVKSHLHSTEIALIAPSSKHHSLVHFLLAQCLSTPCPWVWTWCSVVTELDHFCHALLPWPACFCPHTLPPTRVTVSWLIWGLSCE